MNSLLRFLLGAFAGSGVSPAVATSEVVPKEGFDPVTKLTFEETVAQMSRGYENTQRVIQFMDAKAGAVVALSLAIFAFVGKVVAWAFDKTDAAVLKELPAWLVVAGVVLGLGVTVSGFFSLWYAFKTVRPNHLPNWEAFSTLFPAHDKKYEEKAKERLQPVVTGADFGFVVKEFAVQLVVVGQIVYRKINWLRVSINFLWSQGLASVLLGSFISGLAISGKLVKSEAPTVPAKVQTMSSATVNAPSPAILVPAPPVVVPPVTPVPLPATLRNSP